MFKNIKDLLDIILKIIIIFSFIKKRPRRKRERNKKK
jgi:predicted house-cleaning noncanonical NTP pyrophosphatase (MazG superfamily)